jgi:hypothetical protein
LFYSNNNNNNNNQWNREDMNNYGNNNNNNYYYDNDDPHNHSNNYDDYNNEGYNNEYYTQQQNSYDHYDDDDEQFSPQYYDNQAQVDENYYQYNDNDNNNHYFYSEQQHQQQQQQQINEQGRPYSNEDYNNNDNNNDNDNDNNIVQADIVPDAYNGNHFFYNDNNDIVRRRQSDFFSHNMMDDMFFSFPRISLSIDPFFGCDDFFFFPSARRRRSQTRRRRRRTSPLSSLSLLWDFPLPFSSSFSPPFSPSRRMSTNRNSFQRSTQSINDERRILEQAKRYISNDVACSTALGLRNNGYVELGPVISKSTSTSSVIMNGQQSQQSTMALQVVVKGGEKQEGIAMIQATKTSNQQWAVQHIVLQSNNGQQINVPISMLEQHQSNRNSDPAQPRVVDAEIVDIKKEYDDWRSNDINSGSIQRRNQNNDYYGQKHQQRQAKGIRPLSDLWKSTTV